MKRFLHRFPHAAVPVLMAGLWAGCAGVSKPPPPLWAPGLYDSMAVLPMRVEIRTGPPPLTSEDTELTSKLSQTATEAAAVALRARGYEMLSPLEVMDRMDASEELEEAFVELAAASGLMGDKRRPAYDPDRGAPAAEKLGRILSVDLLVVGRGGGEFHGFGENLVQGLVTGLLTKGRQEYQAPPSYLSLDLLFIDAATGRRVARIYADRMPWVDEPIPLARQLDRRFRRIPRRDEKMEDVRQNKEDRIQETEEKP